jgi:hypothetical protein
MEKEFVPYDKALRMKALGFDEPCFGKYLSSIQSDWKEFELILEMGMNEEFEDNRNIYLLEQACSAPTFSQAFRWFREKYLINSWIINAEDNNNAFKPFFRGNNIDEHLVDFYNTYEEAELACLDKLIDMLTNKRIFDPVTDL